LLPVSNQDPVAVLLPHLRYLKQLTPRDGQPGRANRL
jgi:hypothetical protein